jgi:hypothetical protein
LNAPGISYTVSNQLINISTIYLFILDFLFREIHTDFKSANQALILLQMKRVEERKLILSGGNILR